MRNTFDSLIQLLIVLSFCSDNSLTFSIHNIYYCSRNEVFIPIIGNSSPLESTDKKIHLPQFFSQLHNIQKSLMLRCSAKSLSLGLYSRDRWKKSFSIIFTKKVLLAIHSYYTNRIGVDGCVWLFFPHFSIIFYCNRYLVYQRVGSQNLMQLT